jgi:hypothetical protein
MPPSVRQVFLKQGWLALLAAAAISLLLALLSPIPKDAGLRAVTGVAGGAATFFYFVHKQRLGELAIFQRVFTGFNSRYAEMNAPLQEILDSDKTLGLDERAVLCKYFNLCAEEYFYFSAGIVDEQVWKSWANGMLQYLDDPRVGKFWQEEVRGNSHYGLTLHGVEAGAGRARKAAKDRDATRVGAEDRRAA